MLQKIIKQFKNADLFSGSKYDRLRDRIFTGHVNLGPVTIFGFNAMHYAVNIRTDTGFVCFRPTTQNGYWKWYLYVSPDGTPSHAWWGVGPGFNEYGQRGSWYWVYDQ